jgi:DNA cross-link repair 1A protein
VDGFFGYGKTHGGGGSFGSGSSGNQPWCTNWFLTHFHADHYKGLTKSTPGVGCKIWCSRPTAELCIVKLGIQKERLRVVDVGRPFKVEGVSVTFVDANHCPGAVMIIFDDIPNGSGNGSGTSVATSYQNGPVLATGDCRFHSGMLNCPLLQALSAKKPAVMLDTTYCDPKVRIGPFPNLTTVYW